jgi:hypothetical protein
MKLRHLTLTLLAAALPALAAAQTTPAKPAVTVTAKPVVPAAPATSAKAEDAWRRIMVQPADGKDPLPYTIEVPRDWHVRQSEKIPGLFVGPADAKVGEDSRLIWIRGSQIPVSDAEKVAADIRKTDAEKPEWAAPRVEVKDLGGVRGVLVRIDSGEADKAHSSLILKLPLQNLGIDFVVSAPRGDFDKMLPTYEKVLLSVRPAAQAAGKK